MADVYTDVYHDLYGTLDLVLAPGAVYSLDGINAPRLICEVAWGGTTTVDPQTGYFVLGTSKLDTGQLGSIGWVDVAADVNSIAIHRGAQGELESATPSTATIVLDNFRGDYDSTNTAGPYYGQIDVGAPIWIKGDWTGGPYGRWRGTVDDIIPDLGTNSTVTLQCTDALATLGRAKLPVTAPVFASDKTGTRINRILDLASHPTSQRNIATGFSTCQAAVYGDFALPLLQQVVDTEIGTLYCGRNGEVIFRDRLYAYTNARATNVRALLSDSGVDVDVVTLEVGMRRGSIVNDAHVTRNNGVEQIVTDATSVAKYGLQTWSGSAGTLLETDTDAASIGAWLVARGKTSRLEVTQVTVQAATLGLWATLLQLDILDRLRVVRDYGPVTVDQQVLIEGYEETITKDSWDFTIWTRNVDSFKPFVLNTSKLDTGTMA